MIKRDIMEYLTGHTGLSCSIYHSPAGPILLSGDDSSLKAAVFYNRELEKKYQGKYFSNKESIMVKRGLEFLSEYFNDSGKVSSFEIILHHPCSIKGQGRTGSGEKKVILDLSPFTRAEYSVYRNLLSTGPGKAVSYRGLSEKAKIPGGARFVGNAMAKNIFPVIIPCHRVIKSNGMIGNYSGGAGVKEFLLKHEGYSL